MKYNFLDKLDYLLDRSKLTKGALSRESGIPYTTIDGWYKKGYEGLKLTTLRKLSQYLGVGIGYWVDDENLEPQRFIAPHSILALPTPEKLDLIKERYISADKPIQQAVDKLLDII